MSIYAGAACGFGIVQMNRRQAIKSDHAIEFAKRFLHARFAPDVVTSGKYVRGIETNAEMLGLTDVLYNISDLLEPVTEARALAGCGFERDTRFHSRDFPEHAVDRIDDLVEPGSFTGA